ncbi:hypothetical protein ABAC460_21100 [Asticcacaulis sp. AC460]|uniref:hypothetical protein n=1 Tax=Asticcacaulis sp. AC460 TaxID=1282360 RepID=UPI0003C40EAD|nr:hypothetical protein [Asticcacaulis sp. AC460]ESQ87069.1 hypothetical protein ABAC460_21100 [Asticcacaulis sp. AC460]
MTNETPAILLTSADIDTIEQERAGLEAEISAMEVRRAELEVRRSELSDRLAKIRALLDALGLGAVSQLASNSLYAARNVKAIPRNGVIS